MASHLHNCSIVITDVFCLELSLQVRSFFAKLKISHVAFSRFRCACTIARNRSRQKYLNVIASNHHEILVNNFITMRRIEEHCF